MKKKHKVYLILILITALSLSFYIANSTILSEIAILRNNYFPAPPDKRYYQKEYLEKACLLKEKGDYLEAVKVLQNGLEKVENKNLETDVIGIHERIINIFILNKRINMALSEMEFLMNLVDSKDIIVSQDSVDDVYLTIIRICAKIKNKKLTQKFRKKILRYHNQALDDSLEKPDSITPFRRFYALCSVLGELDNSDKAIKIMQSIVALSKEKKNKYNYLFLCSHKALAELFCQNKDYSSAIKTLVNFLKISKNKEENIDIHIKIANIYVESKNFPAATKELEMTYSLILKLGDCEGYDEGLRFWMIGNVYRDMNKYKLALKLLQKALVNIESPSLINSLKEDIKIIERKLSTKL